MLSPPDGPLRTPSVGAASANVGTSVAAIFGPTGMNTLLDVSPIQKSGFFACAARNACSCDDAIVPDAGMRSYLTVQPFFVRSGHRELGAVVEVRDRLRGLALRLVARR